eukprot:TRINITY_DN5693_c0_g1_i1.p1 TRINITY_DN5693_c0_g1~~TRINITY_DN5693_c0_g1_i1.p1  ORF type:complete len:630 (+),score=293.79 TRINITY_DN5693_c0_g1_i1:153-1892(+)
MAVVEEDMPQYEAHDGADPPEEDFDDIDDLPDDVGDFEAVEIPEDEEEDELGDESFEQAMKNVQMTRERDAPPKVRPTITKQPEVIDDFIRNFLVSAGLRQTLDVFETEWYEHKQRLEAMSDLGEAVVPDAYMHNAQLSGEVDSLRKELDRVSEAARTAQVKWEKMKKQRDFHKLSHNRVMQEKTRLMRDVRRLQQHAMSIEPTLTELRQKYESVMKERMLIKLDRDKLQGKVKSLEAMVAKLEGAPQQQQQVSVERKRKQLLSQWPEDRENPNLRAGHKAPNSITSLSMRSVFKGHSMTVTSVSVHPRKQVVATASDDTTWKIWTTPGGELIMSGDGHRDWVSGVAFHPRGTHLATSSGDTTVKVWDFATASCSHTFTEHTQGVWDVCWHDMGDFLVSASLDHTARIWDVTAGRSRQALRGHVDSVNSVCFQPYANNIVTASGDKTVSLWDPRSGFCAHTFYGHGNAVHQAVFAPKGDTIASVDADGELILWDVRMVAESARVSCGPHSANGCAIDLSGRYVAVASDDGSIYVNDLVAPEGQKQTVLRSHEDAVQAVAFTSEYFLISASSDGTARYWA